MATSNWRMNGLWRRMAGVLVLCTLLLSSEVICQDDTTGAPAGDATLGSVDSSATSGGSAPPDTAPTGDAATTAALPGGDSFAVSNMNIQDGDTTATTAGRAAGRAAGDVAGAPVVLLDDSNPGKNAGQGDASGDNSSYSASSSSGSSVFVGILVSGLLAALGITIGYFKCQRRPEKKGVKLAEEAYPVDQDNQGNTLVSVAPLNPPPETPEKPSANGESTEPAKTQTPPPTNGHSTAKAADTEL
ncbi:unnamed protein product [Ophioblennius macclurei]